MSHSALGDFAPLGGASHAEPTGQVSARASAGPLPIAAQYALSLLMVALATGLAFIVGQVMAAPNLTLIFVLPVVVAATLFGWGPSLIAVGAGVLAFDFFFTAPRYSLRIASPSDLWATGLLLVIAAIVSTLGAASRLRALEARRAAEQAQALQSLAHLVIASRPFAEILTAAANALSQIFRSPAVIFMSQSGALRFVASTAGAKITSAEADAARGAVETNLPARAQTYPYDRSAFDFWPVALGDGVCVIGLDFTHAGRERPAKPERFVEIVGGYLAAAARGAD